MTHTVYFRENNTVALRREADGFRFIVNLDAQGRAVAGTCDRLTKRNNMERMALAKMNKRELAEINSFLATHQ